MHAQWSWFRLPATGASVLALAVLPGLVTPAGASSSGHAAHSVPLITAHTAPARPAFVLGQVKLNERGNVLALARGVVATASGSDQSIHLYSRSGHDFKPAGSVKPSTRNPNGFGISLSVSGNQVIVGGRYAAWIFNHTAQGWKQTGAIQSQPRADSEFGASVGISGPNAIVGDINGHAYIYHATGSGWTRSADLSLPVSADGGLLGDGVAIAGTTAFVNAEQAGIASVYVYQLHGTVWRQSAQVRGSDAAEGSGVVRSLAAEGSTLVIGMPEIDDGAGRVYVFTDEAGTWTQTAELKGSDTRAGDQFGFSVSLSGSHLAVGAPETSNGGAVYEFSPSGNTWTQAHEYTASGEQPNDELGWATAVSDSLVVAGAPDRGGVYVFGSGLGSVPPAVPLKVSLGPQVYPHQPEGVRVQTLPGAHVALRVIYPGGGGIQAAGTADHYGSWGHFWIVLARQTGTATVSVTVTSGSKRRHFTKHFKIL